MQYLTIPNLLSASRILLAPAMAYGIVEDNWLLAVAVLWTAIATDISDGLIARAQNSTTTLGGLLDHGSDAFFVTISIAALTTHDLAPPMLAILIPAAFTQYMLDSHALAGQPLRASSLGRYNGIAYFVFAGWPVMQFTLGITLIPFDWFIWIGWGLVITTVISMSDRLITLLKQPVK